MPKQKNIERKIASIMFTDIVGYTQLTAEDEEKAFQLIKKKRELLLPLLKKHSGKLVKEIGDGTLTRYNDTKDAIDCANDFQSKTNDDLKVRAGIHSGEVIIENGDVFGDVVNVASRLESIAQPKSVLLSKETLDKLENKENLEFISLGLQSLKGVGRLIEVFALSGKSIHTPKPEDYEENKVKVHSDDEVPSIAIIPFENKGANENAFYAYGISADVINDCTDAGIIKVVPMQDIEKTDYSSMEFKELSETFSSRYIAQGVLWKMNDMFQLSIDLYDSKSDSIIWSDRWQEDWDALTNIKRNLCDGLLKALNIGSKVSDRAETFNTEAYKYYLEAIFVWDKRETKDDISKTRKLLNRAIKLDGDFLGARAWLAWTYLKIGDFSTALNYYKAIKLDAEKQGNIDNIIRALHGLGEIYIVKDNNIEKALKTFEESLSLSQSVNNQRALGHSYAKVGTIYGQMNDFSKSIDLLQQAIKIFKPLNLKTAIMSAYSNLGTTYFVQGDYDQSMLYYKKKLKIATESRVKVNIANAQDSIAHTYKILGDYSKAIEMKQKALDFYTNLENKRALASILYSLGHMYLDVGRLDEALEALSKGLELARETKLKDSISSGCNRIGAIYYEMGDYSEAVKYIEEAIKLDKEIGRDLHEVVSILELFACYKNLDKNFNLDDIAKLEKDDIIQNLDSRDTYLFYYVTDNEAYLESAYEILMRNVENMEDELRIKYLNFPNSKRIIEKYEKVFK